MIKAGRWHISLTQHSRGRDRKLSMNLRSAYSTEQVSGQSRIQKTLSQNIIIIIIINTIFLNLKIRQHINQLGTRKTLPKQLPEARQYSRLSQQNYEQNTTPCKAYIIIILVPSFLNSVTVHQFYYVLARADSQVTSSYSR